MYNFNSESFNIYLSAISEIAPLPQEEQKRLVALAQKGDCKARDKIVECNQKFVIKAATEMAAKWHAPIDDLIQAGNIGLLKAIEKFKVSAKTGFLTYARYWIYCEMSEELDFHCNKRAFRNGYKFAFCDDDIFVEMPTADNVEEFAVKKVMAEKAISHIKSLPQTSREVIEDRFGLFGKEEKSLEQIGRRVGKTREWIRQIESRALTELQEKMAA